MALYQQFKCLYFLSVVFIRFSLLALFRYIFVSYLFLDFGFYLYICIRKQRMKRINYATNKEA